MSKRIAPRRLSEAEIAKVRELRAKGRFFAEIGRSVGCHGETARSHARDIPFTCFTALDLQASMARRARRQQAFIDTCNRALGLRPADALVMPGCDGPDFNPSL